MVPEGSSKRVLSREGVRVMTSARAVGAAARARAIEVAAAAGRDGRGTGRVSRTGVPAARPGKLSMPHRGRRAGGMRGEVSGGFLRLGGGFLRFDGGFLRFFRKCN